MKPFIFCFFGLIMGSSIGVTAMLFSPSSYWHLAEMMSWRLHWPAVAQQYLEKSMIGLQLRGDSLVRDDDIVLFGDSHLQAIPVSRFGIGVNYSIGGETTKNLADRIGYYSSLLRVTEVLVMTGRNDLTALATPQKIADSMQKVLSQIPNTVTVTLIAIPPGIDDVNRLKMRLESNRQFHTLCAARTGCRFVSLEVLADNHGNLQTCFDSGDGIHLNSRGYVELLAVIEKARSHEK